MAVGVLAYEVAELCLGKPPLRSLSVSATVGDAVAALKSSSDNFITIWSCDHYSSKTKRRNLECACVGKVCMGDIVCYLCRQENLASPALALKASVSVLLSKVEGGLVKHVEPSSSLLEAIDLILQGAQNLVVPIQKKQLPSSNAQQFCWLTQEDVIRFLLGSIGLFSPIPTFSVAALGLITHHYPAVNYHSPATSAIPAISRSLAYQTSVAVVDDRGALIGEISPFTLACCDETVAAAVMTLSAGDLMAYIDYGDPPEEIVRMVEERLKEKNLEGFLELVELRDEELPSPTTPLSRSYSARMMRRARAESTVCHPGSSLVAVMIQAIAHRVNYVWVIEEDCTLVGIVTFANMLEVFRQNSESII